VGRIKPSRCAGQARSLPRAPERERIAHGPESPGGRPRICRRANPRTGPRRQVSLERR